MGLTAVVVAELLCITVAFAAAAAGVPVVIAVGLGLVAAVAWAAPLRGRPIAETVAVRARHVLQRRGFHGPPQLGRAHTAAAFGVGPRRRSVPGAQQGDGDTLSLPTATGFRWDGDELVCAMQVRCARGTVSTLAPGSGRAHGGAHSAGAAVGSLPLRMLVPLLDQFDIHLSGIDVLARGVRVAGPGGVNRVYARLIGPLAAMTRRDTVLLVRLDPDHCPAAVARRGGSGDGATGRGSVRAAGVAAARIRRVLERHGLSCTMLSAAELDAALHRFTGIADARDVRSRWDHAAAVASDNEHQAPAVHTTYRIPAVTVEEETLSRVWEPACDATVLSVRLRPSPEPGLIQFGVLVRYVGDHSVSPPPGLPAQALPGRQADAFWATTPRGDSRFDAVSGLRSVSASALAHIVFPTGSDGQLVGGDRAGNAVLATLSGPGIRTVEVAGPAYLARQVVVRAAAAGARILVITDRPGEWRHLEGEVADRTVVRVEVAGAPSGSVVPAGQARLFGMLVVDCEVAPGPLPVVPADTTVVMVVRHATDTPVDARLHQDPDEADTVHVSVHGAHATASMVSIPDEARMIGRPAALASA